MADIRGVFGILKDFSMILFNFPKRRRLRRAILGVSSRKTALGATDGPQVSSYYAPPPLPGVVQVSGSSPRGVGVLPLAEPG